MPKLGSIALLSALAFSLPLCAQTPASDKPLTDAAKKQMCETAVYALKTAYVLRDQANTFAAELSKRCDSGAYNGLSRRPFARKLTEDLRAITHDGHMYVRAMHDLEDTPLSTTVSVDQTIAEWKTSYGHGAQPFSPVDPLPANSDLSKYGITAAKRLDGNIGYIAFEMFPDISEAAAAAATAMRAVEGSKVLVFDLRDMHGGSQEMVNLFATYLLSDPHQHLLTMWVPVLKVGDEQYTYAKVSGERRTDIPVYILTSKVTFSAGEAFTYIMQQTKRATVIGETTGGGGHLNEFIPLGQGLALSISVGEVIEPHSKKGWEGTGVIPDVKVPASNALDEVLRRIAEKSGTPNLSATAK